RLRVRAALSAGARRVPAHPSRAPSRGPRAPRALPPRTGAVRSLKEDVMRRFVTVIAIFLSLLVVVGSAAAQGTLRIGMTASDVPYTGGQSDNGFEGFRFVGYQVYEPLIAWDLTRGDRLPPLVPGLAESWSVSKDQPTKWVFKLRRDVKFHDGSPFNADA